MADNKKEKFSHLVESLKELSKKNYASIQTDLEGEDQLNSSYYEKLMQLFLQEYNKKNTFSVSSLKLLSNVLKKIKKDQFQEECCFSGLLTLSVAILDNLIINKNISSPTLLYFETLMLFPDDILITATLEYSTKIYTIIEHYCNETSNEVVLKALTLTLKLLQILPVPNKGIFVKNGLNLWFSALIPTIFNIANNESQELDIILTLLDVLIQELVQTDYYENKQFKHFTGNLLSLYVPIILEILNNDHNHWSNLWIACIKLLKSRLSVIALNDLLEIEEKAFKMNCEKRCIAFKCWKVLIDAFILQKAKPISRKIKLLTLPLLSYNAKSEEVALAKFDTWWHLITKLNNKCDISDCLFHFLMFCFGKQQEINSQIPPGMLSRHTKMLGIRAFANLLGHYDCNGCVGLVEINEKYITSADILKNKIIWIHSMSVAIDICVELDEDEIKNPLKCAWKSFIVKVCELNHDILRKEQIFLQLLSVLQMTQQKCCFKASNLIISTLIPTLLEIGKDKLTDLVVNDGDILDKLQKVLSDTSNNNFYSSCDTDKTLTNLRQYTDWVISNERDVQNFKLDYDMKHLPSSISGLMLWTAYVESIIHLKYISCSRFITNVIIWPIKQNITSNVQRCITLWMHFYEFLDSENLKPESNKKIIHIINDKLLLFLYRNKSVNTTFSLTSIISLIKQNIKEQGDRSRKQEHLFLNILTKQMNDQHLSLCVYLHLLECLELLFNFFKVHKDIICVKKTLSICNVMLKTTPSIISEHKDKTNKLGETLKQFLESMYNLMKIEDYSKFNSIVVDGVKIIGNQEELFGDILPNFNAKEIFNKCKDPITNAPKNVNIVNRVIENGEEFVQVESNWKFNPKKLTENQREKLQRKREDIPALYQDLSQSQDEFKSKTWKANSNDTTTSSRSLTATTIDNHNIEYNELAVPKIVLEKVNNTNTTSELKSVTNLDDSKTPQLKFDKCAKSPRVALKDRISRNVQNLKEKSIVTKDLYINPCSVVCTKISLAETPDTMSLVTNNDIDVNTPAGNKHVRPHRKIKTPIKFQNSTYFEMKRKTPLNNYQNDSRIAESDTLQSKTCDTDKQHTNDNPPTDTPKADNEQNVNKRKATSRLSKETSTKQSRLQKLLAINMVDSQSLNCALLEDQAYATRKKMSNIKGTMKATGSEPVKESQSCADSASQDIIESSQDSAVTAISVLSTKANVRKHKGSSSSKKSSNINDVDASLLLLSDSETLTPESNIISEKTTPSCTKSRVDITGLNEDMAITPNVTQTCNNTESNLTETFNLSSQPEIQLNTSSQTVAESDTQPLEFAIDVIKEECECDETVNVKTNISSQVMGNEKSSVMHLSIVDRDRDVYSSPVKDLDQRRKDFHNSTVEISPIKSMSPAIVERAQSIETSDDYVTISLACSDNGIPCETCESPELFSEIRSCPCTRDMSPPRDDTTQAKSSPSSGLSLKKRTPVRSYGRAAQMLGLCVPETSNDALVKISDQLNTMPRRNLHSLYNNTTDDTDSSYDTDDSELFLKLKRTLPANDCSPAGPILKRKYAAVTEGTTPSPASKKKRVSLHDPPVSATKYVKKYIDPRGDQSPQRSQQKRQEDQMPKSQKNLDNILAKTVESLCSLDTPEIEVVDSSNLNNIDPIFPELTSCENPIEDIAEELSSPSMKTLLVKELEGEIMTVGDFARLTEIEVNRLFIKAPKVKVAKEVLQNYWKSLCKNESFKNLLKETVNVEMRTGALHVSTSGSQTDNLNISSSFTQTDLLNISNNFTQTDQLNSSNSFTQTDQLNVSNCGTQTPVIKITHEHVQTDMTGDVIQERDIAEYLSKKPYIINTLDGTTLEAISETFLNKLQEKDWYKLFDAKIGSCVKMKGIEFLSRYLCERFETKDSIGFLCEVLKTVSDTSRIKREKYRLDNSPC